MDLIKQIKTNLLLFKLNINLNDKIKRYYFKH